MFSLLFFRSGHGDAVKFLIEYGCSPNLQDHQHSTPLHLAAEKGHIQVVEVLLSYPDTNLVSYHDYQVIFLISRAHQTGQVGDFFALVSMKSPNFCQ